VSYLPFFFFFFANFFFIYVLFTKQQPVPLQLLLLLLGSVACQLPQRTRFLSPPLPPRMSRKLVVLWSPVLSVKYLKIFSLIVLQSLANPPSPTASPNEPAWPASPSSSPTTTCYYLLLPTTYYLLLSTTATYYLLTTTCYN